MKNPDEHEQEQIVDHDQQEQQELVSSPIDNVQEDDVLIEENVTPFYMNSGMQKISRNHSLIFVFIKVKILCKHFIVWVLNYQKT
jgi:hypothetical protein